MTVNDDLTQANSEVMNADQLKLMQQLLAYLQEHSPYYSELFKSVPIDVNDFQNLEQLQLIPMTSKKDLSKVPEDFQCVPDSEIIEYVTTSGTLSEPLSIPLTITDIDRLGVNEMQSFEVAGCDSTDIFQLSTTMDKRFMAGMAYYEGVRKLKAKIIRVGASHPAMQWDSILRFKPTVLIAIPSFVLTMLDYAKQNNIDVTKTSVQKIIAIGQPIRNADLGLNLIAQKIVDQWKVQLHSTYASTEMATAFTECEYGEGGHLYPDLLYLEVIDEEGLQVNDDEIGEIVISTFGIEGMPLLRYKTGDLAKFYSKPCRCGRSTPRLGPILGRKQYLLKVKGTTVHPSMIIPVLEAMNNIGQYLIQISHDQYNEDQLTLLFDTNNVSQDQAKEICDKVSGHIRVKAQFELRSSDGLNELLKDPLSRKSIKILDLRK